MNRHLLLQPALVLLLTCLTGCRWLPFGQKTRYQDPAWPLTLSSVELVEQINRQNEGLHAWRSHDTAVTVHIKGKLPQRLAGSISCEAPDHFHLKASNWVALADLGSNSDHCWVYMEPGDAIVWTWQHEDAELLQYAAPEIPRLDPQWLMAVLGVTQLDAAEFSVSRGAEGSRDLHLTSTVENKSGPPLRRVIVADTLRGVVREHALYDANGRLVARATLNDHKSFQGNLIPQSVKLEFPQTSTNITMRFGSIEPNCKLPESYWMVPQNQNTEVVDLGMLVRSRLELDNRNSQTAEADNSSFFDGSARPPLSSFSETERRNTDDGAFFSDTPHNGVRPIVHERAAPEWDQPPAEIPDWDDPAPVRANHARRGW